MKLFPRSLTSTLDPSITVIDPTPPRTRFFNVSEPVGPQLSKHMLAFSRAACPCSPHILKFQTNTNLLSGNFEIKNYTLNFNFSSNSSAFTNYLIGTL